MTLHGAIVLATPVVTGAAVAALLVAIERYVLRDWRTGLRPRLWGCIAALSLLPLPAIFIFHAWYVTGLPEELGAPASDPMVEHEADMASFAFAALFGAYLLFSLPVFLTALFRHGMWQDRNELTPLES
ncbi:hypothetical protein [Salinarimonas ramus]|uniref:Cytochrome bd terminal oxidase subunit II n=1 Tax=Salinarimonas ramus TaxID=690164 RepID=A0A917Q7M6_9HYPH|nr:hypothetical protein [Salinarimonas ramus]GGK33661.1 hypothetical protein GCM10011322_20410 [Salinarimonas ramus]